MILVCPEACILELFVDLDAKLAFSVYKLRTFSV